MRYSGIQPQYFPRLHYFARILHTDMFVLRDEVQFVRRHKYPDGKTGSSYQTHTPIKRQTGIFLLPVPARHEGYKPINQTKIAYVNKWTQEHLKCIEVSYAKAPYFDVIYPQIQQILTLKYENLSELNIATTVWGLLYFLGKTNIQENQLTLSYVLSLLKTQNKFRLKDIIKASELSLLKNPEFSANEKIIALCKELGASEDYCGGTALTAYMDEALFKKHGIKIVPQEWKCEEYQQQFMKNQGFIPDLSIIDLFMNVPPVVAEKIIRG